MSDPPAKGTPKVRDLDTLNGVNDYVRGDVADSINYALDQTGSVPYVGVVLAHRLGNERHDHAQPAVFGGSGVPREQVEEMLRVKAVNLAGDGVLYVDSSTAGRVRFVLEHRTMGDHVWTARIVNKRMGEIMGPVAGDTGDDQTRFLRERYMN